MFMTITNLNNLYGSQPVCMHIDWEWKENAQKQDIHWFIAHSELPFSITLEAMLYRIYM